MDGHDKERFIFKPIGIVHNTARYRYETPRQPSFDSPPAYVDFLPNPRFETALADLVGFDRVWLIAVFHLNINADDTPNWNPKVRPPVSPDDRRFGVFATRSPHRPNPIALSCVEVASIEGTRMYLRACDLLDGTPVLDVKPYIPEVDAFPDSAAGWRDAVAAASWKVDFSPEALMRARFLTELGAPDAVSFCRIQLTMNPLDHTRKRLEARGDDRYAIGCRTWRIVFRAMGVGRTVFVETIESHYTGEELLPGAPDPYGDKDVHRAFLAAFPGTGSKEQSR